MERAGKRLLSVTKFMKKEKGRVVENLVHSQKVNR